MRHSVAGGRRTLHWLPLPKTRIGHDRNAGIRRSARSAAVTDGAGGAQEAATLSAEKVNESAKNSSGGSPHAATKSRLAASTIAGAPQT